MQDAVAFFVVRLIGGMGLALCAMPRKDVVSAFFRIVLLVMLGLAVLFTLSVGRISQQFWWGVSMCVVAFAGSVCFLLERRSAGTWLIGIITTLALIGPWNEGLPRSEGHWLDLASALASAATLGTTFIGMLLGHRYLTAPGMPLAPLVRLNGWLGVAALFRLLVSAIALTSGVGALTQSTYWSWLALRWLAGILGPIAVCVMVQRILRYRNTQAATGVLFVGVILTFIGELSGDLLQRALRIPF